MKILLIGSNGQLGTDIQKVFRDDFQLIPLTHPELEIADFNQVKSVTDKFSPDCIINTAAYHNVPDCEKNPDRALRVNGLGALNLAKICRTNGIKLVHIGTDYVFDGKKNAPYVEEDMPHPLNVYGISKLAGEYFVQQHHDHYIVRVASLFGVVGCRAKGGKNFVETMLGLAKNRNLLQVTSNIVCSPTYTHDAAMKIKEIIQSDYPSGIYHVANSGSCSWYEFALEIFKQKGLSIKVEPKEEKEEAEGISRPLYSALASQKLKPLRPWQEALKAYLTERSLL